MFNISREDKMWIRLFAPPLALAAFVSVAAALLSLVIRDTIESGSMLAPAAMQLAQFIKVVTGAVFVGVAAWLGYCFYRAWAWYNQRGELCHYCGGIVSEKSGRFGLYHHCLQCGKNKSLE